MKPRANAPRHPVGKRNGAPEPGWKAHRKGLTFSNPRPPSVPTTMELRLDEYYAGAALIGVLASQAEEPNMQWVREYSWKLAEWMCLDAKRRRQAVDRARRGIKKKRDATAR